MSRESEMVTITRDEKGVPKIFCDPEIVDLVVALNNGEFQLGLLVVVTVSVAVILC